MAFGPLLRSPRRWLQISLALLPKVIRKKYYFFIRARPVDKEEKIYVSTFIPPCLLPFGPLFRGIGEKVRGVCGAYGNSKDGRLNIISDHLEGRVEDLSLHPDEGDGNFGQTPEKNALSRDSLSESTTSYPESLVGKCYHSRKDLCLLGPGTLSQCCPLRCPLGGCFMQSTTRLWVLGYAWACACLSWAPWK